ncbi:MAG: branched-chain amino acid ABC transporter permease [Candidatus Onthomonas sp.]
MKKLSKQSKPVESPKLSRQSLNGWINYAIVLLFFVVIQAFSGSLSSSLTGQLVPICTYVVMAVSLNLVVGVSGELSLGHAGFMSVGAFTGVIVSACLMDAVPLSGLRLLICIVVAAALAAVVGALIGIPVLRLRGDYLAIVTLAFGEIIKNVVNCLYVGLDSNGLHVALINSNKMNMDPEGTMLINGPMGALGITKISSFLAGILLVLFTLFIVQNLVNSRAGRAIMAIRDNRIAAESSGISVTKYKMMAFVLSAALAGAAGALYALNYSTVVAKKFDFNTSILVLVFVVLGGMGNIRGSMIAAAVLTVLPELLRSFADYRMLVYAIVLILVMIVTNGSGAKQLVSRIRGKFGSKKGVGANE